MGAIHITKLNTNILNEIELCRTTTLPKVREILKNVEIQRWYKLKMYSSVCWSSTCYIITVTSLISLVQSSVPFLREHNLRMVVPVDFLVNDFEYLIQNSNIKLFTPRSNGDKIAVQKYQCNFVNENRPVSIFSSLLLFPVIEISSMCCDWWISSLVW